MDEPSNIKWENLNYHPIKRCIRYLCSLLIVCVLIICSFAVVVFGKYAQDKYLESYQTNTDCKYIQNYFDFSDILLLNKTSESELTNSRINCYCKSKAEDVGYLQIQFITIEVPTSLTIDSNIEFSSREITKLAGTTIINNNIIQIDTKSDLSKQSKEKSKIYPCYNWMNSYLQYRSLQIGIIIVIPFINSLIVVFFTIVTKFERNPTLTSDISSNMYKCFYSQFINTAVVLILVNLRVKDIIEKYPNFFILAGNYEDFDSGWYSAVGTTIIFTMFINIFTPHISSYLFSIYYKCLRCCDSGCGNSLKTKKLTKKSYFALYVGPDFRMDSRYSQVRLLF